MRARLLCEKPDEIEFTLKLIGPAREFEALRDMLKEANLDRKHPASAVCQQLDELLAQARRIYWPSEDKQP